MTSEEYVKSYFPDAISRYDTEEETHSVFINNIQVTVPTHREGREWHKAMICIESLPKWALPKQIEL